MENINNTQKAKRTVINFGGIPLEVFMLPDGKYTMSQTQVVQAIKPEGKGHRLMEWLEGNSSEAIEARKFSVAEEINFESPKPLSDKTFSVAEQISIEGNNAKFNAVPFKMVFSLLLRFMYK